MESWTDIKLWPSRMQYYYSQYIKQLVRITDSELWPSGYSFPHALFSYVAIMNSFFTAASCFCLALYSSHCIHMQAVFVWHYIVHIAYVCI